MLYCIVLTIVTNFDTELLKSVAAFFPVTQIKSFDDSNWDNVIDASYYKICNY